VLLPPTHPRAGSLYRITADAVRPRVDRAADVGHTLPPLPTQPPGRPWTTLDLVLFGWLAAQGGELPHTRGALYDEVLHHESSYWTRQYERLNRDEADPPLLAQAAAALTLMAPFPHASNDVLRAVPLLADADQWRHGVARAMNACLDNGAGQRVAIRPDPVGDRHLVITLTATPGLLERLVPAPRSHHGDAEQPVDTSAPTGHDPALVQALVSLTRAAQDSPDQTVTLVLDLLHADPGRWVTVLAAAQQLGGPHEAALIQVVTSGQPALPLAALDAAIPLIARQLTGLGLLVTQRRIDQALDAPPPPADHAALLGQLSHRRSLAGDRAGALTAIDEAVTAYRRLAEANPATFLPNLARSLNNQSNRRADTGDRAGALTAIDEAVTAYRRLAEANPAAFLPDLAMSLRVWTGLSTPSRASEEIDAAWRSAIGSAAGRLAVGELLALWCEVATEHGWSSLACAAIADAAEPLSEDHPGSPAHFVSRARQTARSAAARLGSDAPGLPEWVVAPIADEHLKVINGWLSAASWGEREAALARDPALVENGSLARTVSVVTVVYPEVDLRELADFLRRADEHGLDEAAAGARGEAQRLDVIGTWIATGAWADSLAVLTDNLDLLTDDETLELLDASDDPTARQHDDAAETAFAAMDHADLDLLTLIMIGCAQLQDEPAGHLGLAILLARQGDIDAATAQAARARSASSDNQRRAWTIHLTRLRAALPAGTIDLAPFDDVAAIIEAPSES